MDNIKLLRLKSRRHGMTDTVFKEVLSQFDYLFQKWIEEKSILPVRDGNGKYRKKSFFEMTFQEMIDTIPEVAREHVSDSIKKEDSDNFSKLWERVKPKSNIKLDFGNHICFGTSDRLDDCSYKYLRGLIPFGESDRIDAIGNAIFSDCNNRNYTKADDNLYTEFEKRLLHNISVKRPNTCLTPWTTIEIMESQAVERKKLKKKLRNAKKIQSEVDRQKLLHPSYWYFDHIHNESKMEKSENELKRHKDNRDSVEATLRSNLGETEPWFGFNKMCIDRAMKEYDTTVNLLSNRTNREKKSVSDALRHSDSIENKDIADKLDNQEPGMTVRECAPFSSDCPALVELDSIQSDHKYRALTYLLEKELCKLKNKRSELVEAFLNSTKKTVNVGVSLFRSEIFIGDLIKEHEIKDLELKNIKSKWWYKLFSNKYKLLLIFLSMLTIVWTILVALWQPYPIGIDNAKFLSAGYLLVLGIWACIKLDKNKMKIK